MDFTFTPEQDELRAVVRTLLRNEPAGTPQWTALAKLGACGLAVPEEHGGFGAGLVEVGVVLEEAGAALSSVPYLSTVVAAAAIEHGVLLPDLAAGTLVGTVALGTPCTVRDGLLSGVADHVLDGDVADVVIVSTVDGLYAARVADATREVPGTLDQTRGQARLVFTDTPATRVAPPGGVRRAQDLLWAALAVESVGVARASLAMTVEYLRTRHQFGQPLAAFQALRHRVADLYVAVEAATSSAWYALRVAGTGEFAVAAPLAKLVATQAAYQVTAQGIQLHGGTGFTWEHDAHRYFKRATANQALYGDPLTLRRIIAERGGALD
ncbi:MAG TPA: acyl-CoA dehydrogenase family protein [Rugosimonospora sp.]|nr:acyl-CoA dehydrogenase family protein [Rugosimonospora sp.]